jgi:hypothetical protein
MATTAGEAQARPSTISYVLGGLALAGLLAMSIWFFATGLMAPLWAVIGFIAVWVGLVVLGVVWIRRHPWRVLLLPWLPPSSCSAACAPARRCSAGRHDRPSVYAGVTRVPPRLERRSCP